MGQRQVKTINVMNILSIVLNFCSAYVDLLRYSLIV